MVIFLTDGLPTEGVTGDRADHRPTSQAAAPADVRLFAFGVGDDVNTILLDTLAEQNRGASAYVRPGERIDEQVSAFYAKVSTPVLADIELDFGGVRGRGHLPLPAARPVRRHAVGAGRALPRRRATRASR